MLRANDWCYILKWLSFVTTTCREAKVTLIRMVFDHMPHKTRLIFPNFFVIIFLHFHIFKFQ